MPYPCRCDEGGGVITFYAVVNAVKTLADNGIRVYLDLPEDATDVAVMLMECKRHGLVLNFQVTEHEKREPPLEFGV